MILIFLTCANRKEAGKIARGLLGKRLVACAKTLPVGSQFLWKGKKTKAREVLLLLETVEQRWEEIEDTVRGLHSYESFVMFALPVKKTTREVREWLQDEID